MNTVKQQYDAVFTTDIATIGLQFAGSKLVKVDYLNTAAEKKPTSAFAKKLKADIEKYLKRGSKLKNIKADIQLHVTPFHKKVLQQLEAIPYGETRTYGEIAQNLNTSARAVGNACRNNPIPIIIPCHRVVAASGIGGYDGATSGGRLNIKSRLLAMEGVVFPDQ